MSNFESSTISNLLTEVEPFAPVLLAPFPGLNEAREIAKFAAPYAEDLVARAILPPPLEIDVRVAGMSVAELKIPGNSIQLARQANQFANSAETLVGKLNIEKNVSALADMVGTVIGSPIKLGDLSSNCKNR